MRIFKEGFRQEHKSKINEYKNSWRKKNPDLRREYDNRRRARQLNQMGDVPAGFHQQLFVKQKGKCHYCTNVLDSSYHLDHKIPLCRGGLHDKSNLCLSCAGCNLRKNRRTEEEFITLINGENTGEERDGQMIGQKTNSNSKM